MSFSLIFSVLHVSPSDTDALLAKLFAHISEGDYTSALAATDAALSVAPTNNKGAAAAAKGAAAASALPEELAHTLRSYRAYCLYRLARLPEAISAVAALPATDVCAKHLSIQTNYRLGRFAEAAAALDALLPTPAAAAEAAADEELLSNALAVRLAAGQVDAALELLDITGVAKALLPSSLASSSSSSTPAGAAGLSTGAAAAAAAAAAAEAGAMGTGKGFPASHELAFNAACVWAAAGLWPQARAALARAKALFHASAAAAAASAETDEEEGNEGKADTSELVDILAQDAYVLQKLSDHTGASLIYSQLLSPDSSLSAPSAATAAVLTNNAFAATAGTNGGAVLKPAEAARRVEAALSAGKEKLLPHQRAAMSRNVAVLLARAGLATEAKEKAKETKGGTTGEFAHFLSLAILVKEKNAAKAEATAREYAAAHPTSSSAALALVHLHLLRDQYPAALAAFDSFLASPAAPAGAATSPAATAVRLAILSRTPGPAAAAASAAALSSAITHWEGVLAAAPVFSVPAQRAQASELLHALRGQAAEAHVRAGRPADAVAVLKSLADKAEAEGESEAAGKYLARVVALTAESDPAEAAAALKRLPPVAVKKGAEVDALEAGPAPVAAETAAIAAAAAVAAAVAGTKRPHKKRGMSDDGSDVDADDDDDDEEEVTSPSSAAAAAAAADSGAGALFLPNGKRVFSSEKLAAVRAHKKARRRRMLPPGVTPEAAAAVAAAATAGTATGAAGAAGSANGAKGPDPYRWLPKWERPVTVKSKGAKKDASALMRGPQGSGVSENTVEMSIASPMKQQVTRGGGDNRPRNKRR